MRTLFQCLSRNFKGCYRLLARDGWERVQKLIQTVTGFKTVNQVLNRNACADKHGSTTENLRVAMNDFSLFCHESCR